MHLKIQCEQKSALFERDSISVNQFIASAAAEKMAAVMTDGYMKIEAALGKRADF